jgi:hypothetical protein
VAWAQIIPDLSDFLQRAHLTVQSRRKKVATRQQIRRETYLGSGEHEDGVPLLPVRELAARRLTGATCGKAGSETGTESRVEGVWRSALVELEGGRLEGVGGERPEEVEERWRHAELLLLLGGGGGDGFAWAVSASAPAAERPRERGEGHGAGALRREPAAATTTSTAI